MEDKINLLKNYSVEVHAKSILGIDRGRLLNQDEMVYLKVESWSSDNISPQLVTHLLDSYFNLKQRPDIAFSSLWTATNIVFRQYYLRSLSASDHGETKQEINDNESIRKILNDMFVKLHNSSVIGDLSAFIDLIPEKLIRFFVTQYLKSFVFFKNTENYYNCAGFYKNFVSHSTDLHNALSSTYGMAYMNNSIVSYNLKTKLFELSTHDPEKSQKIIRSCTEKIKTLITAGAANFTAPDKVTQYSVQLDNEKKIRFVFRYIIYASRNHLVHGKTTSRLNSPNFNLDYYASSLYLYFLTYFYFSLFLIVSGDADEDSFKRITQNKNIKNCSGKTIFY